MKVNNKFLVFQLTSRRKYDVAEILSKQSRLKYLLTDFYIKNTFFDKVIMSIQKSFGKYRNNNISENLVYRSFLSGIIFRLIIRFFSKKYFNKGLLISSKVLLNICLTKIEKSSFTHVYAFDTGAYEIFKKFRSSKELILEQCVAPRRSQMKMYKQLSENYNLSFDIYIQNCQIFLDIESKELSMASKVICPSLYVKNELIKNGVNNEVINVVPYGFNNPSSEKEILENIKVKNDDKEYNILFVGNEAIRKGVVDIIQVAKELEHMDKISFHLVGDISKELNYFDINIFPSNITIHGKLGKEKLFELYFKSSLFFMPSYLEGSALVNYEALSFGVPLLTTFESGSVIENKTHGYIVKPGQTKEMTKHIMTLFENKELSFQLSRNAYDLSKNYTLENYRERLNNALG